MILPKLKLWAGRDHYRLYRGLNGAVFEIGFWWKPLPIEDQEQGMMIKARFAARLRIVLPAFQWWYSCHYPDQGSTNWHCSRAWTGREVEGFRLVHGFKFDFWRWS